MIRELSLFTGAGGGLLGTMLLGWRPVGYVEFNDYCQRVIAQRIRDGILPNAPIFGDIRTFVDSGCAELYRGVTDVISGGFPCQPFSLAGKRAGADDTRNMWPATVETIRIVRPRFAFLENVPGLVTSGYFGTVLGDLAESGYGVRWRILSAAELGAPHRRDRLWIVAHTDNERHQRPRTRHTDFDQERNRSTQEQSGRSVVYAVDASCEILGNSTIEGLPHRGSTQMGQPKQEPQSERPSSEMADTNRERFNQSRPVRGDSQHTSTQPCGDRGQWWQAEPDVGGTFDGLAA